VFWIGFALPLGPVLGVARPGAEIHVLYESGAKRYSGADYRVRTIHHAPVAALGG
jgi:hypothetical protein